MKMLHIYEQRSLKNVYTLFNFEGDNKGCGLAFRRKKYIKSKLVGFTFSKSFSILLVYLLPYSLNYKNQNPKSSFRSSSYKQCQYASFISIISITMQRQAKSLKLTNPRSFHLSLLKITNNWKPSLPRVLELFFFF